MLHEMGHALGMAHPNSSGSSQLSGTASCAGTETQCTRPTGNGFGYDTVMRLPHVKDSDCTIGINEDLLSSDDKLWLSKRYPL